MNNWVSTLSALLQALAAVFAVFLAYKSILTTVEASRRSAKENEISRQENKDIHRMLTEHVYYKTLVTEPVFSALESYKHDVTGIITDGQKHVINLKRKNTPAPVLDKYIDERMKDFSNMHLTTAQNILFYTGTADNVKLNDGLVLKLDETQDYVIEFISLFSQVSTGFSTPESKLAHAVQKINKNISFMQKLVKQEDPIFKLK